MKLSFAPELLSVIIPSYNYEDFVQDTIKSVAQQSYAPIELIVVDDASSDGSVAEVQEVFRALDGRFVRQELILQPENAGKLAAINRALEMVNGEYTIILDADDILTKDYVERCLKVLNDVRKTDPSVGFVYTDCQLIDGNGTFLDRGRSTAFDAEMLKTMSFIPEPAITLTQILVDAAPYDEEIRCGTKHHKWLKIVDMGWIGHHLPEPLFSYRMHGENLSGIGSRVTKELENGKRGERILSGYWPTQRRSKTSVGA